MSKLAAFKPLPANPNSHTPRGQRALEDSIRQDGYTDPMVAAADGTVISGNLRLETVAEILDVEPIVVRTDGTRPVIHVRTDIASAGEAAAKRIAVRSNRVAELSLNWQMETLVNAGDEMLASLFTDGELKQLAKTAADAQEKEAYTFLDAPQARPETPQAERQRFPLAIVLTKAEYDCWQEHKRVCKAKDDRAALLALLGE